MYHGFHLCAPAILPQGFTRTLLEDILLIFARLQKNSSNAVKSFQITFYFLLCFGEEGPSGIINILPFNSEGARHHHYGCPYSESLVGIVPLGAFRVRRSDVFLMPIIVPMTK